MEKTNKLTFGSLFSGIGGFDLGFERAGMECVWQVENDKYCNAVLERHWPSVRRYGDVREFGANSIAVDNVRGVDVICGGFPCQDVSVAGRREGLSGERSGLWFEFQRIIMELKPQWVVVENVPGLLSSNKGRDMGTVLTTLAECGYWWAYRVLDAQYFGIPQQRRRVFIVGCIRRGSAATVLFETEPDEVNFKKEYPITRESETRAYKKRGGFGWSESIDVSLTIESASGKHTGGNDTKPLVITRGKLRWVTPNETDRIAGFPTGWTDSQGDTERYRQVGNAVSPQVAEWIGNRIVGAAQ